MNINKALISVIVPCYNQSVYMRDAVISLFKQTYPHWECILINDGSTDTTKVVANELLALDSRVKYIEQENRGLAAARNAGLNEARGDYIQFLDADDLLVPEKFELQLADLTQDEDISVSYCRPYFCIGEKTNIEVSSTRAFPLLNLHNPILDLAIRWEKGLSIPCHAWLFDARLFRNRHVRFDESLPNHEDWDCWMQVFSQKPKIYFVDRKLAVYRRHEVSMCRDEEQMRKGWLKALCKQRDAASDNPLLRWVLSSRIDFLKISKEKEPPATLNVCPLVSVIMTSYNYENYVAESMRSVFNQTYRNIELIIVDDGSTDDSCLVIKNTVQEASIPVKTIFKKNGGQASALNAGYLLASGEVIAFLDSDDAWHEDRMEKVLDFMYMFPYGAIYQHQMDTGKGLKRGGLISGDVFSLWRKWNSCVFNIADDHDGALFSPFLPTSGLTFRKCILDEVFPIPTALVTCPDAFITRAACAYGDLISIPATLGLWRDHGKNAGRLSSMNFTNFWLPIILPALNQYYNRHNIRLKLVYDGKVRSTVPAARMLGECFVELSSLPRGPQNVLYVSFGHRIANLMRLFMSDKIVQRIRYIIRGVPQASKNQEKGISSFGHKVANFLRHFLSDSNVQRIRKVLRRNS